MIPRLIGALALPNLNLATTHASTIIVGVARSRTYRRRPRLGPSTTTMAAEKTGMITKVLNLLQTRRRAPPSQLGDGKYDSEESGNTVKSGVIRELEGRKMSVPEELDLYLELVAIAGAGGEDITIAQMVWLCS